MAEVLSKEVLVVFGDRRRPINFVPQDGRTEAEVLLESTKLSFSDVMDPAHNFFFQTEDPKWGMTDVVDMVADGSTVYLRECDISVKSKSTTDAKKLCRKLGEAEKLAELFGSGSRKRNKFDPSKECIVASQQAKKKKTNQRMKPKLLTVVLLQQKPPVVPKGHSRKKLKDAGRILKVTLKRCMTASEVRDVLVQSFQEFDNVLSAQYLCCGKDNIMLLNEEQELDGDSVIELAGQGSLYLVQDKVSPTDALSAKADEMIASLKDRPHDSPEMEPELERDSQHVETEIVCISSDDENSEFVEGGVQDEMIVYQQDTTQVEANYEEERNAEEKSDRELLEWRALRAEQDQAYMESLKIDQQKEKEKVEMQRREEEETRNRKERSERVERMKQKFASSMWSDSMPQDGIHVAFKFGDGRKIDHVFSINSTVMEMYRFVFTKMDVLHPYSLHTLLPSAHEIRLSRLTASDLIANRSFGGSTIMVQDVTESADIDNFLELMDWDDSEGEQGEIEEKINSAEERERLDYMQSINAVPGEEHTIDRKNLYEDVVDLYREGEIVGECPILIQFRHEMGLDQGGVQRDMFSGYWEEAYSALFEGATLLIPLIHPQVNMSQFSIFGRILSHAYLVCGDLPIRIALPSLICMLLGPAVSVSKTLLLETLLDYLSSSEREIFKEALVYKGSSFPFNMQEKLMNTLACFGCRTLPNPSNFSMVMEQIARYEFMSKPAAGIAMIHSGIPTSHINYWKNKLPQEIQRIYESLTISPQKVNSLIVFPAVMTLQQERVGRYLTTMVSNMSPEDLRALMRFITGSCTCITSSITVSFNAVSGLMRHPSAHTCDCSLEISSNYLNYNDFYREFKCILDKTNEPYVWSMHIL